MNPIYKIYNESYSKEFGCYGGCCNESEASKKQSNLQKKFEAELQLFKTDLKFSLIEILAVQRDERVTSMK